MGADGVISFNVVAYHLYYDKSQDALCYKTPTYFRSYRRRVDLVSLFGSYDDKGWKEQRVNVPYSNFVVTFSSNFGYGNSSYLRCSIKYNEQTLVNSTNWCETKKSLDSWEEEPTPDSWEYLFEGVVNAYNKRDAWNFNNLFSASSKLLYYLLHLEELNVHIHTWSKNTIYDSSLAKGIHLIGKSSELMKYIQELKMEEYENLRQVTNEICRNVIPLILKSYNSLISEPHNISQMLQKQYTEQIISDFSMIFSFLRDTGQMPILLSLLGDEE